MPSFCQLRNESHNGEHAECGHVYCVCSSASCRRDLIASMKTGAGSLCVLRPAFPTGREVLCKACANRTGTRNCLKQWVNFRCACKHVKKAAFFVHVACNSCNAATLREYREGTQNPCGIVPCGNIIPCMVFRAAPGPMRVMARMSEGAAINNAPATERTICLPISAPMKHAPTCISS